jgi:hypothetical protein
VDATCEAACCVGLAVDDVHSLRGLCRAAEPGDDLVRIGVHGEVCRLHDLGMDRDVATVHLHLTCAFEELAATGALRLVAGEDDRVPRVGELVLEVVVDAVHLWPSRTPR